MAFSFVNLACNTTTQPNLQPHISAYDNYRTYYIIQANYYKLKKPSIHLLEETHFYVNYSELNKTLHKVLMISDLRKFSRFNVHVKQRMRQNFSTDRLSLDRKS